MGKKKKVEQAPVTQEPEMTFKPRDNWSDPLLEKYNREHPDEQRTGLNQKEFDRMWFLMNPRSVMGLVSYITRELLLKEEEHYKDGKYPPDSLHGYFATAMARGDIDSYHFVNCECVNQGIKSVIAQLRVASQMGVFDNQTNEDSRYRASMVILSMIMRLAVIFDYGMLSDERFKEAVDMMNEPLIPFGKPKRTANRKPQVVFNTDFYVSDHNADMDEWGTDDEPWTDGGYDDPVEEVDE